MRIMYDEMKVVFYQVLIKMGFESELAMENAELFAQNSRDGVYTHGLNRFPRTIDYIKKGYIKVNAVPVILNGFGPLEQWDGQMGIGPSNARRSMGRAVELASTHGIGCVALKNTNHWMRGGAYGLQAADSGCIGICFTNTMPNMPPWGGRENRIGNNPFILAVPTKNGHIMLDMAVSQYSYGMIEKMAKEEKMLPVPGGYDVEGHLTSDPKLLWESKHVLPIGFWKGSGLSIMLDLLAAILSQGNSTYEIGKLPAETSISQIFIAFDTSKLGDASYMEKWVEDTIAYIKSSEPVEDGGKIYYPNERSVATRNENQKKGIPVDESYWNEVLSYL
ncbi:3-dehydro-L-gulonate 2-dehydrogenase [Cellulosilyticum sp. I15G10I2]|uniref:3-dehydro-L-gulonate 2-dehydrogenase n=1 Tax=Cellulosilyticum sp. I15G10I2 TaxID=1892843 RepID=UPI00085BF7E8|nr:3-dehydro-L-gulonate 2-dehydrogenase [Cellulosilyticum sp. I15G10I2]